MAELIKVIWQDAWCDATEPINLDEAHLKHKPMLVTTLGWLLVDNEKGVSLANEHYLDDSGLDVYRGRTFIPRAMVQSIEPFKKPRKPKVKPPNPIPQTS